MIKGTLPVRKHGNPSLMYVEVSPTNEVTHVRVGSMCFPTPAAWSLADIYHYARTNHIWRVCVNQKLTNGSILTSHPLHINDWLMHYALAVPGTVIGIVHDPVTP